MKHRLIIVILIIVAAPFYIFSQHAIVTQKGDTIRAKFINLDRETDLLEFITPQHPDSLVIMPYSEVKELLYRFYPSYDTITYPTWLINTGFGIKFSFYTPGLGNLDNQPLLKEEISRGSHYSIGLTYMSNQPLGVTAYTSFEYYYTDRDSLWAKEKFFTTGIGLAWLSRSIGHDFFLSARIIPTYSAYHSSGKVFTLTYNKKRNLVGLFSDIMLNLHITETIMFQFNTNLHLLHRNPGKERKIIPTLGTMGIGCGFMVFL